MLSRLRKAVPDIHSRYSLPATSSVRPAKLTSWPILDSSSLPKTYHHYSVLYRLLFNRPLGESEVSPIGHSYRNASIGSTRVARHAGIQHATMEVAASNRATATNVSGSYGFT